MLKSIPPELLTALTTLMFAIVTSVLVSLRPAASRWAAAATTAALARAGASQRETLGLLAHEAVHLAERIGFDNADKRDIAVAYVIKGMRDAGITVDESEIVPLVEAALGIARGVISSVGEATE